MRDPFSLNIFVGGDGGVGALMLCVVGALKN